MTSHETTQFVLILVMAIVLAVVAFFELRVLRSRRKGRSKNADLPDQAHNAVITSRAILQSLGRRGITSAEADDNLRQAEMALRNRKHRVALEYAENVKTILKKAKKDDETRGDIRKLDDLAAKPGVSDEGTSKEKLQKELPPNYAAAKFTLRVAREEIEAAKTAGRDVGALEASVAAAQAAFDAEDYSTALRDATRVRRELEGPTEVDVEEPAPAPETAPSARKCTNCGAEIPDDDAFCRKCGAKAPQRRVCGSCGRDVASDDAFCRGCGTPFP